MLKIKSQKLRVDEEEREDIFVDSRAMVGTIDSRCTHCWGDGGD
jgi:hypothetical protein